MNIKSEWKYLTGIIAVFFAVFYLPLGQERFDNALMEGLHLVKWYSREHVILCLVPAFFIAGAIAVFISRESVMKYLGRDAKKATAYGVASVSGSILAVCSCTILPLFSGIYRMGAGLGPATAFLYAGPAINIMAIILTARVLGIEIGIARAVGAIVFSIVIGLCMHLIFKDDKVDVVNKKQLPDQIKCRPLWQNIIYFGSMTGVLIFSNWGHTSQISGFWHFMFANKWIFTSISTVTFGIVSIAWFGMRLWKMIVIAAAIIISSIFISSNPLLLFAIGTIGITISALSEKGEPSDWIDNSWFFAKQILPLLFFGVIIAGMLLGRPGHGGLIPSEWISASVGGNSLMANLFASVAGAFMYFATLTEVPILQGLLGNGMGKGPALALLLAGPALSLPNMLVIRSVMGTKKTMVYVLLVVVMSTTMGMIYGNIW